MLHQDPRQGGFGALRIIVVVAMLVVVGGLGFFEISRHKAAPTSAVATPSTPIASVAPAASVTTPPAQAAQRYLVIKEWGVEMTLDGPANSLYYYIKPDLPDVAYLSLKSVSNVAPNCAADKISLAAIGRLSEADQQVALSKPQNALNHPGTLHVGNYWYNFEVQHQTGCYDNAAQANAAAKAQPPYDLETVFKTLQPVN